MSMDGQNGALNIRADVMAVDMCIEHVYFHCNGDKNHSCEPGFKGLPDLNRTTTPNSGNVGTV